ncbi:DsbA family protein [Sphingomonas mesophila]|uniref:DsbA family protein n=1 Tax=Sphingomonas mesophila TaxID=2303576 RepID=UPI000E590039|nr:DsbA family protein [Sphingomonas mesophila]
MSDRARAPWKAGLIGGLVGAVLTAVLLIAILPQWLGPRIVREGLMRDPEALVAASDALKAKQASAAIGPIRAALETPFASSWKGAAKPTATMTYFYDYACGYCRKSNPDIERLLAEDKGLRVVYRELPILGPDSIAAARVALAASRAGKFAAFHDALSEAGRPTPGAISRVANALALSPADAQSSDVEAEIRKNMALAGQLGATGTPLFVVGDTVINSAAGYDALKQAIAAARGRAG